MSTALRIVRPLPAADQHMRELVLGKVVFASRSETRLQAVPRPTTLKGGHPTPAARALPPAVVKLNRRVVELSLERAGIESALAGLRWRIAQLQADADALQHQLDGITLGDPTGLADEQRAVVDRVLLVAARELEVPIAAVLGRRGPEPVCWARFIGLTIARERARTSSSALGRYLKMDHATVLWAERKTAALRETCRAFRAHYERCVAKLEAAP